MSDIYRFGMVRQPTMLEFLAQVLGFVPMLSRLMGSGQRTWLRLSKDELSGGGKEAAALAAAEICMLKPTFETH